MKLINIKVQIKKYFCFLFVGFLFTLLFYSSGVKTAYAACVYGIQGPTTEKTVNRIGSINFNATITRTGTSGECADSATVVFLTKADYSVPDYSGGVSNYDETELTRSTVSFGSTSSKGVTASANLASFDWSKLPDQNKLQIFARVYVNSKNETTSSIFTVNVTGASSGSVPTGAKNLYIYFGKDTYTKGDTLAINIKLNDFANAKDVDVVTTLNGKQIGFFSLTAAALKTGSGVTGQNVVVNEGNGLVSGTNNVVVKMFETGSKQGILFAQGSAQFQATGLSSTAAGAGAGAKENNAVCKTSGECKSNFCANDTGKCQSCSEYEDGACGTGYTCSNAGVCTANSTGGTGTGGGGAGGSSGGGINGNSSVTLFNPLPEEDLPHVFLLITQGFLGLLGMLAAIFIIVGGIQMVVSAGNEEAITKGKKTITWAVIGLLAALLSFSIIAIVQELLQASIVPTTQTTQTNTK